MRLFMTNNPLFYEEYRNRFNVELHDVGSHELFVLARNLIHKNWRLETHPLAGNIKPSQMAYKTLLLSNNDKDSEMDQLSLSLIENAIVVMENKPFNVELTEIDKNGFMYVDAAIMKTVVENLKEEC